MHEDAYNINASSSNSTVIGGIKHPGQLQMNSKIHDPSLNRDKQYFFENYLQKKRDLKTKLANQHEKFKKSVKLELKGKPVRSADIFQSLKSISEIQVNQIKSLMQFRSPKIWLVTFNDNFNVDLIYNKTININGETIYIQDPNGHSDETINLTAVIRVHWYPPEHDTDYIIKHLKKVDNMNIVEQKKETYLEEDMQHIENGIHRIKIKYPLSDQEKIEKLIGIQTIGDRRVLFQLVGSPPTCLYCKQKGHIVKDCQKKKNTCNICKKTGHFDNTCYASKAGNAVPILNDDEANYEAEISYDQTESGQNVMISTLKTDTNSTPVNFKRNNDVLSSSSSTASPSTKKTMLEPESDEYNDEDRIMSTQTAVNEIMGHQSPID